MACFCFRQASFEAALRKGDVAAALAHLEEDPLTAARTQFRDGNTLWHVAAASGHLLLLQALAARLTAVWPTPQPDPHVQQQHQQHHDQCQSHHRWSNPFQRISDGLRGRGPDAAHLPLAASINTPNVFCQTPLMSACKQGHPGCVQFLLAMGANPWYRDRANCTALHYAALHDQGPCIEALLQNPASARPPAGTRQSLVRLVDLPSYCGYTATHFAAVATKPRAMAALLAGGANIAARCWAEGSDWISGPPGSTPLHLAARRGDLELCKLMMRHYLEVLRDSGVPDPRLHADSRGMRPYQRAAERGNHELTEMLMPSTPLSYIFGTDVRLYNVPKLKALASAALQSALLTQINALQVAAAERRRLATQAAVAAARAAAAVSGGGTAGADIASISRASSLINGAIQFVRRRSMRPLDSWRRRRGSGKCQRSGHDSPQQLDGSSLQGINTLGGTSEAAAGGRGAVSGDGVSAPGGGGGTRTVSGGSGANSQPVTPQQSGVPLSLLPGAMSSTIPSSAAAAWPTTEYGMRAESTAAAAAAATDTFIGNAPLLLAGSERSALVGPLSHPHLPPSPPPPPLAPDGPSHGLAGNAAAAVLAAAAAAGRMVSYLPGGISPVRGSSLDSNCSLRMPSLPSPPCMGLGAGSGDAPLPAALCVPADTSSCFAKPGPNDSSAVVWARIAQHCGSGATVGCVVVGGVGEPPTLTNVPARPQHCPVSAPRSPPPPPLPTPPSLYPAASPFALVTFQASPLERYSCMTPGGASPTNSSIDGGGGGCLSGRSQLLSIPLPPAPGASLALQPVQEGHAIYETGGSGGNGSQLEKNSKRAVKYVLSQPAPLLPAGVDESVGGQPSLGVGSGWMGPGGSGHLSVSGGESRGWGPQGGGAAAAAAAAAGTVMVGRVSGEYTTRRAVAGGGVGGGCPKVGCPTSEAFQLPSALRRETCGDVGVVAGYSLGSGGGGGATAIASRAGSGKLQISDVAVAAAAAAGGDALVTVGSDTSDDHCGVCFERPARLHIRPCKHTLCAECSREVTRMMETQPPRCPFCRGIVYGFGC